MRHCNSFRPWEVPQDVPHKSRKRTQLARSDYISEKYVINRFVLIEVTKDMGQTAAWSIKISHNRRVQAVVAIERREQDAFLFAGKLK